MANYFIRVAENGAITKVEQPAHDGLTALQSAVGGYIELACRIRRFQIDRISEGGPKVPLLLIVNEEGLLKCMPPNRIFPQYVGPVVMATEATNDYGEPDIVGFPEEAADRLVQTLQNL